MVSHDKVDQIGCDRQCNDQGSTNFRIRDRQDDNQS
jgi:hypothetical protein